MKAPPKRRARGRPRHDDVLTPAEWHVVQGVRHGLSNAKIAKLRGISVDAVKYHVANAVAKLQLENRQALRRWRGIAKHSALYRAPTMTSTVQLGPIGQISRAVRDIKQAQAWYEKTLGLPQLYTFGKLAFFDCGGTRLYLSENPQAAAESILYLKVPDIEGPVANCKREVWNLQARRT
jgi:DNA-binding CsgD family transcriptional regulator